MSHPINEFFDKVFVINLITRKDRKEAIETRLNKLGIEFEFYNAVPYGWATGLIQYLKYQNHNHFNNAGEFGCCMSHTACIMIAKERGYKNVLILEDDAVFLKDFNTLIPQYLDTLPNDWNMCYLTCNLWKMDYNNRFIVEPYWRNAHQCNAAAAYAVNSNFYDVILNRLREKVQIIDLLYMDLQSDPNNKIYFTNPNLVMQGWSYSNLVEYETNYFHEGILSYAGKHFTDYE